MKNLTISSYVEMLSVLRDFGFDFTDVYNISRKLRILLCLNKQSGSFDFVYIKKARISQAVNDQTNGRFFTTLKKLELIAPFVYKNRKYRQPKDGKVTHGCYWQITKKGIDLCNALYDYLRVVDKVECKRKHNTLFYKNLIKNDKL